MSSDYIRDSPKSICENCVYNNWCSQKSYSITEECQCCYYEPYEEV